MESDAQGEKIREEYDSVCNKLNMDQSSMERAWTSYSDIRDYYTLEGNQLEWLGCALYVAGQSLQLETVEGEARNGNSVSLTQILRATKLNLIEFFKKMKKWMEMARLPLSFQQKIDALERKFEVASIIYDKYRKVFRELFEMVEEKSASAPSSSRPRGRKPNHKKPCSAYDVFRFGWTLYIHIKSQYPQINDDLVNSHHLVLCCLDMLFSAAYTKRRDLLNPQCPINLDDLDDQHEPSVLSQLCQSYTGIEKECRVIRDYYWSSRLKDLFEAKVLSSGSGATRSQAAGNTLQSLLVLSPAVFLANEKNLNREYEMSVLEKGDFDERVFLHPSANEEIGTPTAVGAHNFHKSLAAHTPPQHVQYGTPLLGRELLGVQDQNMTPVSEATHSVSQLHVLLEGCQPEPSTYMRELCGSCMVNPLPDLERLLKTMGEKLIQKSPSDGAPTSEPSDFPKLRLCLSLSLYYKLLDAIMKDEQKRNQDFGALQNILEYLLFHKSLFSLCVEIVLFSYNSQSRSFPWILKVFDISAYHFYKLIEMAIKLEKDFPRGIIKHLNRVEEMVLSQLAWTSDSPLFDAIDAAGSVPPYKDVALPTVAGVGRTIASPLVHPRVLKLGARVPESPLSALQDRHSSPVSSNARRALFSPGGTSARKSPIPIAPKPLPVGGGGGGVTVQLLKSTIKKLQQNTQSPIKEGSSPVKNSGNQSDITIARTSPQKGLATQTSPAKSTTLPLSVVSDLLSTASTMLSPSSKGPQSPGSLRPLIPTSPPIPSVTITPSLVSQTTPLRGQAGALTPGGGTPSTSTSPRPKRTGSLALFYRKTYQLAYIRIKDLCERLGLTPEFTQKVWTCFEHCMVKSADLLRDRHLDQIIMCSIYILSKALQMDVTFQEIMRQYRHQPQYKSHVYKSVLLNNGPRHSPPPDTSMADASSDQQEVPPPTTITTSSSSSQHTPLEDLLYHADIEVGSRGDVIQFYNKVFIGFIKDFVLQFSPTETDMSPSLSPLPVISKAVPSPRQLSKHHNIFVSPHKGSSSTLSPLAKPIGKPFIIQKSPNVDLMELNKAIKGTKRQIDLTASPCSPAKRQHLNSSSRGTSPVGRKPTSLLQAINSVASDRAMTTSNTTTTSSGGSNQSITHSYST